MKLKDYLKESREKLNLTQVEAGDKIGTSSNTIQNWEYGKSYPERSLWEKVIEVYKLDKIIFNDLYMDIDKEEKKMSVIPSFLYTDKINEELKFLKLTNEEQELLGLETIYSNKFEMLNKGKDDRTNKEYSFKILPDSSLSFLPYEYVKEKGIFKVLNLHKSLEQKIGKYRKFVANCLIDNEGEEFNVNNLKAYQYLELCKEIQLRELNLYEELISLINVLDRIDKANNKYIFAKTKENRKIYDRNDWETIENIKTNEVWNKYINIKEKESEDELYLIERERYYQDLKLFEEGKIKKAPVKPQYMAVKYVEMNEIGMEFYNWYNTYIRNKKEEF